MREGLIWHEMEQGSDEWRNVRLGKITGTTASALLVNGKNDGLGEAAWSLIYRIVGEIVTGEAPLDFDNYAARRGRELEIEAIRAYRAKTLNPVNIVGFIEWENMYAGVSPDFLVDEKRGGEVKCLLAPNHIRYAHTKEIEKNYMAQVQWALFVTGFEVWDLIHFHPNAGEARLIIEEIKPIAAYQKRFDIALSKMIEKIQEVNNSLTRS